MKRTVLGVLAIVVVVVAAGWWLTRPENDYPSGAPGREVIIAITEGAAGSEIATLLKDKDVIKTRQSFLNVLYADDRSKRIQPGGHRLQTRIPARAALEQLLDPARRTGVITIPEGLRAVDVIARLKTIDIDASKVSLTPPLGAKRIEGFLYPGQYAFIPGVTGQQALQAMVDRFTSRTGTLEAASNALNLSAYEGLIAASLLQAEGDPGDYQKILRVILNRLKIGMPLQFDTTVLYALGESGRIRVTLKDLQVNSPYNTYKYQGLPPTPICNPGAEAIAALSAPASGNWLYYITVKPGDTRFTASHDQFLVWKAEFQKNYKAGLFS